MARVSRAFPLWNQKIADGYVLVWSGFIFNLGGSDTVMRYCDVRILQQGSNAFIGFSATEPHNEYG